VDVIYALIIRHVVIVVQHKFVMKEHQPGLLEGTVWEVGSLVHAHNASTLPAPLDKQTLLVRGVQEIQPCAKYRTKEVARIVPGRAINFATKTQIALHARKHVDVGGAPLLTPV